jgi:hypothetical protein
LRHAAGIAGLVYVVLFLAANFPTGVGDKLYGQHSAPGVVAWASGHASLLHAVVLLDLLDDWLFALFVFALVVITGNRSVIAAVGVTGVAAAEAIYSVIRGIQYAVPQLAALPDGGTAAQAAVVLQANLVFTAPPLPLAIGLAAVGYLVAQGDALPKLFGLFAMLLAAIFAISFPLRELAPGLGGFETGAAVGVLLWTAATSVALLLPGRSPVAEPEPARVPAGT